MSNGAVPTSKSSQKETTKSKQQKPKEVVDKKEEDKTKTPAVAALEKAAAVEEEKRQRRERMYRLLPRDVTFCVRMIETHGDDYEVWRGTIIGQKTTRLFHIRSLGT